MATYIQDGKEFSIYDVRSAHPNMSIPDGADLTHIGYAMLEETAPPTANDGYYVERGDNEQYAPNQWRMTWVQKPLPPQPLPTVTALQGMLAIAKAGLAAQFKTWRDGLDPISDFEIIAFVDRAQTWNPDNEILNLALEDLGLAERKDELFKLAATL